MAKSPSACPYPSWIGILAGWKTPETRLKLRRRGRSWKFGAKPCVSARTLLLAAAVLLPAAGPLSASAQTLEEAQAAFDRRSFSAALKGFRPYAEMREPDAQNKLGVMYQRGWGVAADFSEAVKWYRRAARQGQDYAKTALKDMNARSGAAKRAAGLDPGGIRSRPDASLWPDVARSPGETLKRFRRAPRRHETGPVPDPGFA